MPQAAGKNFWNLSSFSQLQTGEARCWVYCWFKGNQACDFAFAAAILHPWGGAIDMGLRKKFLTKRKLQKWGKFPDLLSARSRLICFFWGQTTIVRSRRSIRPIIILRLAVDEKRLIFYIWWLATVVRSRRSTRRPDRVISSWYTTELLLTFPAETDSAGPNRCT